MLPTTGLVGGCGIGLSRLLDAILEFLPPLLPRNQCHPGVRARSCAPRRMSRLHPLPHPSRLAREGSHLRMTTSVVASTKPLSTPFDQFGADFIRLFLLRP